MSKGRGLLRRRLLEEIYDGMTLEDKRIFVQMTMQDKNNTDILQALQRQKHQLVDIDKKVSGRTWLSDFSSNIAGNAVWDGAVWLFSKLIRRL